MDRAVRICSGSLLCEAQRELFRREPEALDDPVFRQRHGLERLCGGSVEDGMLWVPDTGRQATVSVYDGGVDPVDRFNESATANHHH